MWKSYSLPHLEKASHKIHSAYHWDSPFEKGASRQTDCVYVCGDACDSLIPFLQAVPIYFWGKVSKGSVNWIKNREQNPVAVDSIASRLQLPTDSDHRL